MTLVFLYDHHVMKSGLGRITENTPQYQGVMCVIVYSMADLPLVILFIHPLTYEGHPINSGSFPIMLEFVPFKHHKCSHYLAGYNISKYLMESEVFIG